MHKPITSRIRSIVDGLLVHCHEGASSNPITVPCVVFFFRFFFDFICFIILFIYRYHYHFKPFRLINFALMTANNAYPIESMHSVVSHIRSVFDNVPFDGHFV